MKIKYFLITIICASISLTSCSEEESSKLSSESEMLTAKSWVVQSKIVEPSINLGGIEISDITVLDSDEVKSYSFKFDSDGTLVVTDLSEEIIIETTWVFNSDKTQLTFGDPLIYNYPIVGDIGLSTIKITSLTSSKMIGTIPAFYDDINYVVTITFI
ncbi:hypothetical protein [Algibacter sp. L1A34]|uniref:hypothetical protein n=1 Tax=Algibacter sp. L1A34 TaxID=2686365 RepID=UPI00131B0036|nr:hypothetical protein [Algibacter sp. L1A34]